jgi:hypothetical protein
LEETAQFAADHFEGEIGHLAFAGLDGVNSAGQKIFAFVHFFFAKPDAVHRLAPRNAGEPVHNPFFIF